MDADTSRSSAGHNMRARITLADYRFDEVVFAYDTVMYEWDNVDFAGLLFDWDAEDLNLELAEADAAIADTRQAALALAAALDVSHDPAPAISVRPGDELPVIAASEETVGSARAELESLQADHDMEMVIATDIVDQPQAILDSTQARANF
jgi:predicted nucleotide-binding protein